MGWSLSHRPIKEPELLNEFFQAVGKALYIASSFEAKCQFVLKVTKLASHYQETADASSTWDLAQALKNKMLGPTIKEFEALPESNSDEIQTLERAKDARNFIAHECANIGRLTSVSAKVIHERTTLLRQELSHLIVGDNLVSRWVFEIEEKVPAPQQIQEVYPLLVNHWVFGPDLV